jgi:hypothetical protein
MSLKKLLEEKYNMMESEEWESLKEKIQLELPSMIKIPMILKRVSLYENEEDLVIGLVDFIEEELGENISRSFLISKLQSIILKFNMVDENSKDMPINMNPRDLTYDDGGIGDDVQDLQNDLVKKMKELLK